MLNSFPQLSRISLRSCWILILGASSLRAQKIDLNVNGMSDVWESLYGATGLSPAADADGDGMSNLQESIAGTDPYAGISASKINLWSWDSYHASGYGYYLEALLVFGKVTGKDPLSLGDNETVADDMGFSKPQTHALQQIAHDELAVSNRLGQ